MKQVSVLASVPRKRHDGQWSRPPTGLTFPSDRLDVWQVRLDEPGKSDTAACVLSYDEVARANRFHFEKDRNHFSRCRSTLRCVLASYLAVQAAEIRFQYLPGGKPQIAAEQNPRALQFNVSHSAGMALIAVGSQHRLGVDVEKIRGDVDTAALAKRFFSLYECAELQALPVHLRVPAFFACWTRKESFLKATGDGLSFPLGDFSVTTHPDCDPVLQEIRGDTRARDQWFLADLNLIAGYRAAIAVETAFSRLETILWPSDC
jgi:4'-phosphopantetheinyl transferase